ncbi:MAG: LysR family transcriptional regulator [Anaerovoracaceae bacterium]|nr:LysR family transcriptional regulator [Anaerovoracaceae bacterium]
MNISQLQYFQVTCKYQNISRAAEELHVSQSAVSKSIRELEKEFELNLFRRVNNNLILTQEGKIFLDKASQILGEISLLYTQARDMNNANNTVRFGMTPLVGRSILPPFYQELKDFSSEIILEPFEMDLKHLLEEIEKENIDVGLIISNDVDTARLESVHLMDCNLQFFTNIFNPLSKKDKISFSDLKDEPIILLNPDSIETKLLMERFSRAGVIPNIIFYSDQVYTIQHSINHEIASSFLYNIIVPRNHEIKMIPLEFPVVLHISLVWKKDRYVHSGVQKIIKLAKSFKFEHYHG